MLTPIQAILSAILTGFIVQLLTIKFNYNNVIDKTVPEWLQLPKCALDEPVPPPEVNKLLDAIFVTHATEADPIEEETPIPVALPFVTVLNESNFQSVYTGDWLILAHVPWFEPAASHLDHFTEKFPEALKSAKNNLNLATIDCQAHSFLCAVLQIRQYPSLLLVTDSGRLRDWPFELKKLDQEALSFLINSYWKHLPVYQLLKQSYNKQPFLFTTLQIRTFNLIIGFMMSKQPIIFNWITKNRPITSGILGFASLLLYKAI